MKKFWKILKWAVVIVAVLFVIAQFFGPAKTNPATDESLTLQTQTPVDPKALAILDRSCADCHSNNTRWPWYANVAPVSWLVIGDVNEARHEMNFSEWGKYDQRRRNIRLGQICDLTKAGEMPLSIYTPLHPGSKLSADDVKVLCDWTEAERGRMAVK